MRQAIREQILATHTTTTTVSALLLLLVNLAIRFHLILTRISDFHYGYHVLTAAVIAHMDPSWLAEGQNRAWVNSLIRDYANPSAADPYFPVSRMFDWYHGHSFAHGLFESSDGRDQESSSEDTMAAYALKMWGFVSGDANTAARGNLMLAVQARSLNNYYLYTGSANNNTANKALNKTTKSVEPANFIGNRVAGILFENKLDHTTYFGTNIEYIQGIHMLPLLPSTSYIRRAEFVKGEWAQYFSDGRADSVVGGWRGILYGNLATVQPGRAWSWFSRDGFDPSWLDGGASLTWYMAYSAGESSFGWLTLVACQYLSVEYLLTVCFYSTRWSLASYNKVIIALHYHQSTPPSRPASTASPHASTSWISNAFSRTEQPLSQARPSIPTRLDGFTTLYRDTYSAPFAKGLTALDFDPDNTTVRPCIDIT
jgi:hypothetical protein